MSINKEATNDSPKSSLADIILVIAKHLLMIVLFTIVAVIITIVHVNRNFKPEYTSTAKVFLPADGGRSSGIENLVRNFGLASGATSNLDISSSTLYPEIVTSQKFASAMLKKEFYTEKFEEKLPLLAILTYGTGEPLFSMDTIQTIAATQIPGMINFTPQMGFFIIDVTTNEKQFSKDLADAFLKELDFLQREHKSKSVREKTYYIDQQINIVKTELEYKEESLKRFRERNRNVTNSPSLLLKQERLQRDVEIQKGIFLTLKQQLELAKIEEVQKSSFVQVLDPPSLPVFISNPKKKSTNIIGGIVGFLMGLLMAFVVEYFTNVNNDENNKLCRAKDYLFSTVKKLFTFKWFKKTN